jgi:hypothetical protein
MSASDAEATEDDPAGQFDPINTERSQVSARIADQIQSIIQTV